MTYLHRHWIASSRGQRLRGVTLIELLVVVTIIGILASMALGGMYRASIMANEAASKSTVAKVNAQLLEIWDSYRYRRLPIDPTTIFGATSSSQYASAQNWVYYLAPYHAAANNVPLALDPLNQPLNANNAYHIAAVKLAITRELMRLEMPVRFKDFTDNPSALAGAPTVSTMFFVQPPGATTNPTALSEAYRQFFMSHATQYNSTYEPAECLYMILKFASQNDALTDDIFAGVKEIGDADGDGMPEIQDAFFDTTSSPSFTGMPTNKPISFLRWPLGLPSPLQNPTGMTVATSPSNTQVATPVDPNWINTHHDPFDQLKVDARAFALTPLVYSAGADGIYDIWELTAPGSSWPTNYSALMWYSDPYYTDYSATPPMPAPGSPMDPGTSWPNGSVGSGAYGDNITNHVVDSRIGT